MQIALPRITFAQTLHAVCFAVEGHHQFAVQQQLGEIPDAAPHFHHALAQFAHHQPALPGEITNRPRHLALVFQRELDRRLQHHQLS